MALAISELNTIQHTYYDGSIQNIIWEKSTFLNVLKNKYKRSWPGGNDIQWPVKYKLTGRARPVSPRAAVDIQSVANLTGAKLDWAYYLSDTMMHWDEQAKNRGPAKIVDLMGSRNKDVAEDLADQLATDIFTQNALSNSITSLVSAIDAADTYAGIAVADAAQWASVEDSSTTVLTLFGSGGLAISINSATLGDRSPTDVFTTRNLYSKVESLVAARQQTTMRNDETRNLGVKNFEFHQVTFQSDPYVPAGYLYALDMKSMIWRTHPDYQPKRVGWRDLWPEYPEAVGLLLMFMGQLQVERRDTSVKYSALDYTL